MMMTMTVIIIRIIIILIKVLSQVSHKNSYFSKAPDVFDTSLARQICSSVWSLNTARHYFGSIPFAIMFITVTHFFQLFLCCARRYAVVYPRQVRVVFVVDKVGVGQTFFRVRPFLCVSVTPVVLHTHQSPATGNFNSSPL